MATFHTNNSKKKTNKNYNFFITLSGCSVASCTSSTSSSTWKVKMYKAEQTQKWLDECEHTYSKLDWQSESDGLLIKIIQTKWNKQYNINLKVLFNEYLNTIWKYNANIM